MANPTKIRSQPYRIDWTTRAKSIDELNTRLSQQAQNIDAMFQILFEQVKGIIQGQGVPTVSLPTLPAHSVVVSEGSSPVSSTGPGALHTVLHGEGTTLDPVFSPVVESDIVLSDVTTDNVSTAAHGFAPKAPNDATKFLSGVGTYLVPPGGGPTPGSPFPLFIMDGADGEDGMMGPPGTGGSGGGGGLTAAQIAARVLIDGTSGGVNAGSAGPKGAQGIQGIQGAQGQIGPMGVVFDGEDGDSISGLQRIQVFDGDLKAVTTQMFSWVTRSDNTTYQAASDGFVVAQAAGNSLVLTGYTDSSNPPTTVRAVQTPGSASSTATITFPVKKNDYYKVTGSPNPSTVFWIPFGTAG